MQINVIVINHQTQNYNKTRGIIFECEQYVIFPFTNPNSTRRFLTSYADLSKNEVEDIVEKSLDAFNYVFFRKAYPRYWMNSKIVKLL